MTRSMQARIFILITILIILPNGCIALDSSDDWPPQTPAQDWEEVKVVRVVDGDTLVLDDGRRLRMIGINAPEIGEKEELYGLEAAEWLHSTVANRNVFLQKDISDQDQHGRTLRYVWLATPEQINEETVQMLMVSALMVSQGYAQPYTFPPDVMYAEWIMTLAREARRQGRGLWALNPDGTTRGTSLD
jgi:micrococcal nuclease